MPDNKKLVDREALKAFRVLLDQHFINNGEYDPTAAVGNADSADNLSPYSPNSGLGQQAPFVFQSTAGGSDVGALCQLKSLRGQSYAFNQLLTVETTHTDSSVVTTFNSETGIFTAVGETSSQYRTFSVSASRCYPKADGHKILLKFQIVANPDEVSVRAEALNDANSKTSSYITSGSSDVIFTSSTSNAGSYVGLHELAVKNLSGLQFRLQCFDLTQMFGAGNEPTSVEEFNRLFPLSYYAYNEGELVSCQASKLITVGYNQFDELDTFIKVVAGQTYTIEGITNGSVVEYDGNQNQIGIHSITETTNITLTNNTQYVKVLGTGSNICFHLTWDGSKTGYEAYSKHEYGLPNEVLRSAGSAYDEIKSNGTKITRIGVVDLGSLTFEDANANGWTRAVTNSLPNAKPTTTLLDIPNLLTAIFTTQSPDYTYSNDECISIDQNSRIVIRSASFVGKTGSEISDILGGMYLYYELATPVESESIAFQENIAIDDWGTMEFVSTYPQGNDFFYYVDYKAFIDSLGNREDIGFDANKIVSQEELTSAMSDIDLTDYVTVNTEQNITGKKTHTGDIELRGSTLLLRNASGENSSQGIKAKSRYQMEIYAEQGIILRTDNNNAVAPHSSNRSDLGTSSSQWKDLHLTGKIKDGTNEVSVAQIGKKLLSIESQRHLTSGEAKQCVGGVQVVSDYYLNLGNGVLLKNPYITGIQSSTTKIQILASGLNTSNQMVFHKAELTINDSDDTVAVTEGSITTVNGTDMANLIDYAKTQGWIS